MINRFYKRHIAEGRDILIFVVIFAVIIRIIYFAVGFISYDQTDDNSYIWNRLSPLVSNPILSYLLGFICTIIISWFSGLINTQFVFIRKKTALTSAIPFLLLSSSPLFFTIKSEYFSTLAILLAIYCLFKSYDDKKPQMAAFNIGALIAISSLFNLSAMIYLPIFWIGMSIMNSLNFKGFLSSVLAIIFIYIISFSIPFFTGQPETFLEPFNNLAHSSLANLPISSFDVYDYITLALTGILLLTIAIRSITTQFKDKIKVRAYISFFITITIFSFLAYSLLNLQPQLNLYIGFCTGSFLLAHFFALNEEKWTPWLFYILLVILLAISLSPFYIA